MQLYCVVETSRGLGRTNCNWTDILNRHSWAADVLTLMSAGDKHSAGEKHKLRRAFALDFVAL
eukprot:3713418-Pleurochrysis_carterae.AAC.1